MSNQNDDLPGRDMPEDSHMDSGTSPPEQFDGQGPSDKELITKVLEGRSYSETFDFPVEGGEEISLELSPIYDRQKKYDYLSKLPSGWFEASQKDDPEDVDDFASLIPDGDGIGALEDMVIDAAKSQTLAPTEIEDLVRKGFSDEVVTQMGLHVIQMSADVNKVTSFRKRE